MDVVYVCRSGDNEELRYSIRSVVANFETVGKVWVVGSKPDWYSGNFIAVTDTSTKFNNIRYCIKAACESDLISDNFLLMNDDFFILRNQNSGILYHGGLLYNRYQTHTATNGPNGYAKLLLQTHEALRKEGVEEPLNYDLHTPMVINKEKMLTVVDQPLSIRSYYGNKFNVGGNEIEDVKVYESKGPSKINSDTFLSTEDRSFSFVENFLKEQFPIPSIYEM